MKRRRNIKRERKLSKKCTMMLTISEKTAEENLLFRVITFKEKRKNIQRSDKKRNIFDTGFKKSLYVVGHR